MTLFPVAAIEAAKKHAREAYPAESCGIIFGDEYVPMINKAEDPMTDFVIDHQRYAVYAARGTIQAIIHSHPGGPLFPTETDMRSQLNTAVPWGIIPLLKEDGEMRVGDPFFWGDQIPRQPLIGRTFRHGICDCYSLIRDTFALGRESLAEQGITDNWPYEPRLLPEVPRDDGWWNAGKDLYVDGLEKNGFRIIKQHEARAGDGFLINLSLPGHPRHDKLNHGGVLVTDDLVLHHLPGRLSRREPAGMWGRQADLWVRHEG